MNSDRINAKVWLCNISRTHYIQLKFILLKSAEGGGQSKPLLLLLLQIDEAVQVVTVTGTIASPFYC